MGWDCTFHLVDPRAVRKAIGLLVRGKPAPDTLVASLGEDEARRLWSEAARRVLEDSPEDAATIARQIAIHIAASTHPHRAERGVALSFQVDPTPRSCGPWIPERYTASVEPMFKPLLKKRPELEGRFHRVFEHNSDTGVFIPAKHAEDAAEAVRSALYDRDDDQRHRYWSLYRVLRAAARHKLAYWEATDLYPAQTHAEMIDPVSAAWTWLEPAPDKGHRVSATATCGAVFLRGGPDEVSLVLDAADPQADARPCPPKFDSMRSARLHDGRWVTHVADRLEIFEADEAGLPGEPLGTVPTSSSLDAVVVRACGDGAVIVPWAFARRTSTGAPWWFDGTDTARPIEGLPAPKRGSLHGSIHWALSATTLGSGPAAVLWNGDIYEIADGKVVGDAWRTGLQVKHVARTLHAIGDDVYFGRESTLMRVRRGEPARPVSKMKDPILRLSAGPTVDGSPSVLVVHYRHLKKRTHVHTATIVFPDDGDEIALHRADTDLVDHLYYAGEAFWGRARRDPTVNGNEHLFRLPLSAVLQVPRTPSKVPKR